MLARLRYNSGSTVNNILTDISSVLGGVSNKATLSANLDKVNSSIVSVAHSTWNLVSSYSFPIDALSDDVFAGSAMSGGFISSQPCSNLPSKSKHFKMSYLDQGAFFYSIGSGSSDNLLSGNLTVSDRLKGIDVPSADGVLTESVEFTIHSSGSALIIHLSVYSGNTLVATNLEIAVFDFENTWFRYKEDSFPTGAIFSDSIELQHLPINSEGSTLSNTQLVSDLCTSSMSIKPLYIFDERHKNAGFKAVGSSYDLIPFGVSVISSESMREQFPYAGITRTSRIYLTNKFAFGESGYFKTPIGVLCKLGHFMVEVK